jgi:hypothetical protein
MTQTDSPRVAPAMDATAAQDVTTSPGLFEEFRTARAGARGPIVCVDAEVLLINATASRFVSHDDHHELWHWAQLALDSDDRSVHALPLLGRQLQARRSACPRRIRGRVTRLGRGQRAIGFGVGSPTLWSV